jgi:hypothetical protein
MVAVVFLLISNNVTVLGRNCCSVKNSKKTVFLNFIEAKDLARYAVNLSDTPNTQKDVSRNSDVGRKT